MNIIKKHAVLLDNATIIKLGNEYNISESEAEQIADSLYEKGIIDKLFCIDGSFSTFNKTEEVCGNAYFVLKNTPAYEKLSKEYISSNYGLLRGWINIDEDVNREEDPFAGIEPTVFELTFKTVDAKNNIFEIESTLYDNSRAVAEVFAEIVSTFITGEKDYVDTFSTGEIELDNVEAYDAAKFGISMFGSVDFTRAWNESRYVSVSVNEVTIESESGVDFYVNA